MNTDLESILSIVLDGLRENYNFNSTTYNLWFADLKLISLDECRATFTTPSNVRQRILSTKFYSQIKETLTEAIGYEVEIDILSTAEEIVFEEVVGEVKDPTPEEKASADKRKEEINKFLDGGDKNGEESLVSRYTFDNFIEGESNKLVRAACFAVASNPTSSDYNPLFIYGESGLGKTHLLFAVINMIKKGYPGLNIVYKTCEEFTNELVSAISKGYKAYVLFIIQMAEITEMRPNDITHKAFGDALSEAYRKGVNILALDCKVTESTIEAKNYIDIVL